MLIQKLRLQRGWSQEQLAALSGLSVRTIQRLERGQPASTESLKALGAVFEIDFSTLREEPMTSTPSDDEALALAHVRRLRQFYLHVVQYLCTVAIFAAINLAFWPHQLWFQWVALGWGSGVVVHGLSVYDKIPFLGAAWEKRQVERLLGREL